MALRGGWGVQGFRLATQHITQHAARPCEGEEGCVMRPRLLDLFCGAGGCAVGYHRAGFDVVGVDIKPQPNYPFEFHRMDALKVLAETVSPPTGFGLEKRGIGPGASALGPSLREFDAVHASPPCQGYLNLTRVNEALGREHAHPNLIAAVRDLFIESGVPYVIENVSDAAHELSNPVRVCGTSFGLPLRRHRLFESNVPLFGTQCAHHLFTEPRYWTGWRPNGERRLSTVVQVYGNAADKHEWPAAMGIDWMTSDEMAEAVPPAYTEHIGHYLLAAVESTRRAA
jgi:DNA (cytosine-5)-methyltransferase 1